MALSATQKKVLTYGVPAVLALLVFVYIRSQSSSASTAATTTSGTTSAPDNTAIGVDQLASFENGVEGQIQALAQALTPAATTPGSTTVAPPANPIPATVSPAPTPSVPTPQVSQLDVGGALYNHIPGPSELAPLLTKGGPAIYAVEAGTAFEVANNGATLPGFAKLPAGTGLYVKAP